MFLFFQVWSYKLKSLFFGFAIFCGAITSTVSGAVTTYSNLSVWTEDVVAGGSIVASENFNSYNGFYPSAITGSTGGITWTANAPGGLYCDSGIFSTNDMNVAATFTFAPGVQAVGGNIFGTSVDFSSIANAKIKVTLADGSAYIGYSSGPADFVGFISNGAAISSMTILATKPSVDVYVAADNLFFGVTAIPAPGAAALLGLAALVSRRRR